MSTPRSRRPDPSTRRSGGEDLDKTKAESPTPWADRLIAAIEDGSLRAKWEAETDPGWLAKCGDAAWEAFLFAIGYGPFTPAADLRRSKEREGKK